MRASAVGALALVALVARCGRADKAHGDKMNDPAFLAMKAQAERDYYAPYAHYGKPEHLLTDIEWGRFETRNRKPRACALPGDQGVAFHLFCYLRDDSPSLLAHFLRWYAAAGLDFKSKSRFVVHATQKANASAATARVFKDYGVPRRAVRSTDAYTSSLKVQAVNDYLETLNDDAWLVYPDVDEFFAFPCAWGGRVLPLVDHMARQSVDGPVAAAIISDWSLPENDWLRALAAGTDSPEKAAPWAPDRRVDFVGGEMFDRVARSWRLEEPTPPPPPGWGQRWTEADIGVRSLFRQFPASYRVTGCLLHLRPFKHALTRATCASSVGKSDHGLLRQRFESSHLTGCYYKDARRDWVRRTTPPKMHEPTLAFAHFRFTADGARSLESKRAAYARAAAQWRNAHGGDAAPPADAPPRDRLQYANMNHAQKAYRAMQLLYKRDGDTLVFRDEVQVVTHVDCYGDRPLAPVNETTGERAIRETYGPATSGRLHDQKRKRLLQLLAVDASNKDLLRKLNYDYFTMYFARNSTKSGLVNKKLAQFTTLPPELAAKQKAKEARDKRKGKHRGRGHG